MRITRKTGEDVRIAEDTLVAGKVIPSVPGAHPGSAPTRRLHPARQLRGPVERPRPTARRGAAPGVGMVRRTRTPRVLPRQRGRLGRAGSAGHRAGPARLDERGHGRGVDGGPGAAGRPGPGAVPGQGRPDALGAQRRGHVGVGPGGATGQAVAHAQRRLAGPLPAVRDAGAAEPHGALGRSLGVVRHLLGQSGGGGDRAVRGGRALGRVRRGRGGARAPAPGPGHRRDGRPVPRGAGRGRLGGLPAGRSRQRARPRALHSARLPPAPPVSLHHYFRAPQDDAR